MNPKIKVKRSEYFRVITDPSDAYYSLMYMVMVTPEKTRKGEWYVMEVTDTSLLYNSLNLATAMVVNATDEITIEGYEWFIDLTDAQWASPTPAGLPSSLKYDDSDPPISSQKTWQEWATDLGWNVPTFHDSKVLIGNIGAKFGLDQAAFLNGLSYEVIDKAAAETIINSQ